MNHLQILKHEAGDHSFTDSPNVLVSTLLETDRNINVKSLKTLQVIPETHTLWFQSINLNVSSW